MRVERSVGPGGRARALSFTTSVTASSTAANFSFFDEPVIDNRFLIPYYGDMRRWSFTLQLEFLIKRVAHHEIIDTVPKSCIQDRTLIEDPEIFAKYLHGLGHMTDDELELYFEYFERLNRGIRQPDKVICFQCSEVNVLMNRIRKRGPICESHALMLNRLNNLELCAFK